MSLLWRCITGPKLYAVYDRIRKESVSYEINTLENLGNKIITGLHILYNIGYYTMPCILISAYSWDTSSFKACGKMGAGLALLMVVGMAVRGLGRYANPTYTAFIQELAQTPRTSPKPQHMVIVENRDFEFSGWPVNFNCLNQQKAQVQVKVAEPPLSVAARVVKLPVEAAAYVITSFMARQLIYPGSVALFHALVGPMLEKGRSKLVLNEGGKRRKILTRDGNSIDTMFVDRRNKNEANGKTLVVCCEGNAGFYEIGIMEVPLGRGYSVLGWNHPGFAGSDGKPYPRQEQNAIDGVMQYAIDALGFREEDIIVFGWSIGGYTATWAAMNYPQIGGLILDATFHDVLPLAVAKMPGWLEGVTTAAIRTHFNLVPGAHLELYPGPVTIVRRTKDEIITTDETRVSANLGNDLLKQMLRARYPNLITRASIRAVDQYLNYDPALKSAVLTRADVDEDLCHTLLATYVNDFGDQYPVMIGDDMEEENKVRILLFLASKHFVDFDEGHNQLLQSSLFRRPWKPILEHSYVQVD